MPTSPSKNSIVIPLEQGLRRANMLSPQAKVDSIVIPLEQGLRRVPRLQTCRQDLFYCHSIRTRIKTSVDRRAF